MILVLCNVVTSSSLWSRQPSDSWRDTVYSAEISNELLMGSKQGWMAVTVSHTLYHSNTILTWFTFSLYFKGMDTFSNCQRPVFSLGVSQHAMSIQICDIWTQLVIKVVGVYWKKKTPLLHKFVCFQMPNKRLQAWSRLLFEW